MQELRDEVRSLERDLSNAKDDIVRAQRAATVRPTAQESGPPKPSASFISGALKWAQTHVTLAFPAEIKIVGNPVTLTDRSQQVKVPVLPGGELRAVRFHPSASGYLVVAQKHSDKLLATIKIENSNFVQSIAPKYVGFLKARGEKNIKNPYEGSSSSSGANTVPQSPVLRTSTSTPAPQAVTPSKTSSARPITTKSPTIIQSKPMQEQKGEDFLKMTSPDSMMKKSSNDHGKSCVCKECRAKKLANGGGALFPNP